MRDIRKLTGWIITTAALTACGQNHGIDSSQGSDKIAPTALSLPRSLDNLVQSRMVDRSVLFADVILRYDDIEEVATVSRQANTELWEVDFRLPSGRNYSLDVTWYDTADGARLDLVNFSRDFPAAFESGQITIDFSNYDFDDYDADGDGVTNLAEREAGTSPIVAAFPIAEEVSFTGGGTNLFTNTDWVGELRMTIDASNTVTGFFDIDPLPGAGAICGAGDFSGYRNGAEIYAEFQSNDTDAGCTFDKSWVFTLNGSFSQNETVFSGDYRISNGEPGVFSFVIEDSI